MTHLSRNTLNHSRPTRPAPVYCIVGETVREVRIWTEEQWERMDPAERPSPAEYAPGLGWVAATHTSRPR
jgi:hypothetical protein